MPLDGVAWAARAGSRSCSSRPSTGSSTRACTRGWAPSRPTATASAWAGTATAKGPASTAASRPRGPTRTCASSPRTSSRRCSWPTCARRSARRCSRPTATRSVTGAWLFVHNGYIGDFPALRRDLMMAIDPHRFPDDPWLDGHRGGVPAGIDLRSRARPDRGRSSRPSGSSRTPRVGSASPRWSRATFGRRDGETPVGRSLRHGRARAIALRLHRRRRHPPPLSRQRSARSGSAPTTA